MAASAPRVQSSSGPRPAGPLPVYPASSQMMMIPQQQISFGGSQSYFIPPGQVRPFKPFGSSKYCRSAPHNMELMLYHVTVS